MKQEEKFNKVQRMLDLSQFIERLEQDPSYEALKIKSLLEAYRDLLGSEVLLDAILTDVEAGAYACQVR